MSQLRKEYKEFKQIQQKNFMEAAELWTADNVIIINERLNRNAIYRLNTAIQRFDNKFGKYRDQLPAIADILDKAENGLHLVINGKIGSRSTAQMLQRMSIIYNILTNFFGGDLGALLKTPAFRVAHEQPDEKIDKIVDRGHNVKAIRRNLAAALKPSDEERTIFRRAYKSFEMPTLDWNMAAKQLCCLSCNELKDLTGVERVPMVVVDESDEEKSTDSGEGVVEVGAGAARAYGSATRTLGRTADTAAKYGIPLAGAAVGGAVTAAGAGITGIINRFKSRSKEMTAALDKLEKLVGNVEGFEKIDKALGQLREKSKAAANSSFDPDAGVRGLLKHPSVVVMKQAVIATEAIEGVLNAWNNNIKSTYKDGIKPEDLPKIKKELEKTVKGGVFSKIKGALTGVKPFPGLSQDDIINAVMAVASNGVVSGDSSENKGTATPPTPATGPARGAAGATESIIQESYKKRFNDKNLQLESLHTFVSQMMLTEDYKDLEKLIGQIGTFEKGASGKTEDQITKDLQSVQKTGTTPAAPKTPAAPQQGQPAKASESTNVEPITSQQQAPAAAKQIAQEAEVTAQQDPEIDAPDIDTLKSSVATIKKFTDNPLNVDFVNNINKIIPGYKIPGISSIDDALKFVSTYENVLTNMPNIKKAIGTTIATIEQNQKETTAAPAAPGGAKALQEKRQYIINRIKNLILEIASNPVSAIVQPPKPLTEIVYEILRTAQTFNDLRQSLIQHYKSVEQWNPTDDLAKNQKKSMLTTINSMTAILINEAITPLQKEYRSKRAQKTIKDMAHGITINLIRSGPDINGIDYSSINLKFEEFIKNFRTKNGIVEPGATTYGKRDVQKSIADAQAAFEETAKKGPVTKQAWKQQLLTMLSTNILKEDATDDGLEKYGYTSDVINNMWNDYISKDQKNIKRLDQSENQKPEKAVDVNLVEPSEEITVDSNTINNFNRYVAIFSKSQNPTIVGVKNKLVEKYKEYKLPGVNDFDSFVKFINDYSGLIQNARQIRKLFSLINKSANLISRTKPEEKKPGAPGAVPPAAPATAPAAAPAAGASTPKE